LPVYEYRCSKGHEFELHQSFSAPTQQKCIQCSAKARRMISNPAVIFKGSGFYSTDNRRSSGATSSATASAESSSSDSAPATGSVPKSDNGHGHSHGGDGHSHDKPAKASALKSEAAAE
jgi:putative FmdB family regulatory protein